jgi:hypothetical protein
MAKDTEQELTQEEALVRAQDAASHGILAQMGVKIDSSEEVRLRMATALVDATSVDALLAENSASSWGEHEGRSVLVRHVSYAPSTKKGGLGFYAVVDAVDVETDEPLLLISGGENVVIQLAKLVQMNGLAVPVKLVANQTGDGNTVHRLVKGEVGDKAPY